MIGKILSINLSRKVGEKKQRYLRGELIADYGLKGDAHAGTKRQVSFLDSGEINRWLRTKRKKMKIFCGDFAENITTDGINWSEARIDDEIIIDNHQPKLARLSITQIGKECHLGCAIRQTLGDCIMPRAGVFARVREGGQIAVGQKIYLIKKNLNIRVGILIASDKASRGKRVDTAGPAIRQVLKNYNCQQKSGPDNVWYNFANYRITPDDKNKIIRILKNWTDEQKIQLIFTCGGTGFGPRDITPEATKKIIEKEAPGLAEMMRVYGANFTPQAWLSRAIAGIRKQTLIINLPGSEKAVRENLKIILPVLPHALKMLSGDTEH